MAVVRRYLTINYRRTRASLIPINMPSTRIATAREDVMVRVFGKLVGTALILLPELAVAV
jgi:hypothetical protein